MAREPDQTRWVGIRPTDPSEDIPTTTRKLAPAVGDLQAVKSRYMQVATPANKDCSVAFARTMAAVPADEIWVMTSVSLRNLTSMCDMEIKIDLAGDHYPIKAFFSVEPNILVSWEGVVLLTEGYRMYLRFEKGGVADDLEIAVHGYIIGVY